MHDSGLRKGSLASQPLHSRKEGDPPVAPIKLQNESLCIYGMFTVYACSAIWLVQLVDHKSQVLHTNGLQVKPDPPSMGGGADTPD